MQLGAQASCELRQHGLTWVLAVDGEADAAGVETVETAAKEAHLEAGGILIVDLTAVTFIDTSFIRWLVGLKRRIERRDASVVVIVGPGEVREVFALSGMAEELAVVEDGLSAPAPPTPA
jgi:anti-anti-sigma factor